MAPSGITIYAPQLQALHPVLAAWVACTQHYVDLWSGSDLPYWYNERANVSILAGAAWKAGFTAIEEYQSQKTHMAQDSDAPASAFMGRNDLYIANAHAGFAIEAKVAYPDLCNAPLRDAHLLEQLNAAIADARKLTEEGLHIAALFAAPSRTDQPATDAEIAAYLHTAPASLQARLATQPATLGAHAWIAPARAQSGAIHKPPHRYYYPVVSLFLALLPAR